MADEGGAGRRWLRPAKKAGPLPRRGEDKMRDASHDRRRLSEEMRTVSAELRERLDEFWKLVGRRKE